MNSYDEEIIAKNIRNLHFSLRLLAVAIIILMIFEYMLEAKLKAIRYDVEELKAKETRREILWRPYGITPAEYHLNEMETKNKEEN